MSDTSGATSLTVDDLMKFIAGARAGTTDQVSTSLGIFQGLGENVVLSGDVLRHALLQASISLRGPLADVLGVVGSVTKTGNLITVVNNQEIRPVFQGHTLRLKQTVTFEMGVESGNPSLSNIVGIAVHEGFWINIEQVQLRQQAGQRVLHVVTREGSRNFPLS